MRPRILLWTPLGNYLADLLGASSDVEFARVWTMTELTALLSEAHAIVMLRHLSTLEVAALVREKGRRLRWIQLTTAGYDGFIFHGVPADVVVTKAGPSHAPLVAEHAITLLTPHVSGIGSPGVRRRIAALVEQDLARFISGKPLLHRVT